MKPCSYQLVGFIALRSDLGMDVCDFSKKRAALFVKKHAKQKINNS